MRKILFLAAALLTASLAGTACGSGSGSPPAAGSATPSDVPGTGGTPGWHLKWQTTEIDWWPGNLTFYLDGRQIYHLTGNWVPDEPMSWIIQNESALFGPPAPENSAAQLNLAYVAVYSYAGERS